MLWVLIDPFPYGNSISSSIMLNDFPGSITREYINILSVELPSRPYIDSPDPGSLSASGPFGPGPEASSGNLLTRESTQGVRALANRTNRLDSIVSQQPVQPSSNDICICKIMSL